MKPLAAILFTLMAGSALADTLPLPPVPPEHPPVADSAPVPDIDAHAPAVIAEQKPSVDVRLYRAKSFDTSMGFAPGSRYQSSEDRKPIQTPGLSLTVPLK
ncbi:MAG TPA: hypothetical protein VE690_12205 [Rhodopila sp.]|jgi:hypothetical protein|nr:hypothetical protein [Rhodopila sp.]